MLHVAGQTDIGSRLWSALRARSGLVWLGLVFGALTVWLTLQSVDLGRLPAVLGELRPLPLILAGILFPAAVWLKALQWQRLCCPPGSARVGDLFAATWLGLLVNNLAPARIGDVLRLVLGIQLGGLSPARAVSSMLVEKVLDLFTLGMLGLALLPLTPLPGQLKATAVLVVLGSFGCLAGLNFLARSRPDLERRLRDALAKLPSPAGPGLVARLEGVLASLGGLEHPSRQAGPLGLSLLCWVLNAAMYGLVLSAFDLNLPATAAVLALVATHLGMALPSSPGFVGIFDYLCVVSLASFGVDPTTALAFALVIHAYGLLLPPILGLALVYRDPRLRSLVGIVPNGGELALARVR